jgi:sugar transferase EpsL
MMGRNNSLKREEDLPGSQVDLNAALPWPQIKRSLRLKRVIDIIVSAVMLIVGAPFALLIGLTIRLTMGSPVLFIQKRIGYLGQSFAIIKFRTMTDERDADGQVLSDRHRLTRVGRFLRAASLDELPELLNVLRGEMSLVGPRPLYEEYRHLYSPEQWRRHEMPPGLAGSVSAAGRNALSWEQKFKLDVQYIENWSLWLDFRIVLGTTREVLRGRGVSAPGHPTMPKFQGSSNGERIEPPMR